MANPKHPPGPGFWEGLATGQKFSRDALGLLTEWQRKYGDIASLNVGSLVGHAPA